MQTKRFLSRFVRSLPSLLLVLPSAYGQTTSSCLPSAGYTLGYFNGVFNSPTQAAYSLYLLAEMVPSTVNGKTVSPQLFYNETGCNAAGATCLEDVAEVFIQKAQEVDSSGTVANSLEYFWEAIGQSNPTFIGQIESLYQPSTSLFTTLQTALTTEVAGAISFALSSPPTAADYATHNALLDSLLAQGQMLMLVAHSQGNLFVNQAYTHVTTTNGTGSVAVVHVAPASSVLHGNYVLNQIDLIIQALGVALGPGSVPSSTLNVLAVPPSTVDFTGHGLNETYLDRSRGAQSVILQYISSAMNSLTPPACSSNNPGSVTYTYTGKTFSSSAGPYSGTNLTATLVTNGPLPANVSGIGCTRPTGTGENVPPCSVFANGATSGISIISATISNGVTTYNVTSLGDRLETDSNGIIVAWQMGSIDTTAGDLYSLDEYYFYSDSNGFDSYVGSNKCTYPRLLYDNFTYDEDEVSDLPNSSCGVASSPGTWSGPIMRMP